MIRLKSRTQCPPDGFRYIQKEMGWKSWEANPTTQWDFNLLCQSVQRLRIQNPRFKLNTSLAAIADEVDMQNALRVAARPNTEIYLVRDDQPPKFWPPQLIQAAGRVVAGVESLANWWGAGGEPVNNMKAEFRAGICAECPQNGKGDLTSWFTLPASRFLMRKFKERSEAGYKTSHDASLGVCLACSCPLKLKVHCPLEHIEMTEESKAALDPRCWILSELANENVPAAG